MLWQPRLRLAVGCAAAALGLAAMLRLRRRRQAAPALSEAIASLAPGKHAQVRVLVDGTADPSSVRAVSKRLVFFRVAMLRHQLVGGADTDAEPPMTWEALVKYRDGCLDEAEIAQLVQRLSSSAATAVSFEGFPEVSDDNGTRSASLHVVRITMLDDPPLTLPGVAKEPTVEAPNASNITARYKEKKGGARLRPNTASRHQQFVAWLVETYGLDELKKGAGVLDVAGGAGGVAFELAFRRGIPCVVVDPRPMRLNAKQRRALKNRVASQAVLAQAELPPNASWWLGSAETGQQPRPLPAQQQQQQQSPPQPTPSPPPPSLPPPPPPQEQQHSDAPVAAPVAAEGAAMAMACQEVEEESAATVEAVEVPPSWATAWAEEGLPAGCLPRQICGLFDERFADGAHATLWRDCSVVVGMHSDQATEPIVRAAVAAGKPFAVVPCCVFPKSNTHRRLPGGRTVQTTEELCEYLEGIATSGGGSGNGGAQRHQRSGRASGARRGELRGAGTSVLSFEGKNTIVYSVPT